MKTILALALMAIASLASAQESCTYAIKDNYGYEYETLTRYSYSRQAACSDADFACRQAIAEGQRYGRYYDAHCEEKWDRPQPPRETLCTTDLIDWNNYVVRSFTGSGRTEYEACQQSENSCRYELGRYDSRYYRCITRRNNPGPGPGPGPRPPRQTTESCTATRFDPQGIRIQDYFASWTGPVNTDVKGEACRQAMNQCQSQIRGRQFCNVR